MLSLSTLDISVSCWEGCSETPLSSLALPTVLRDPGKPVGEVGQPRELSFHLILIELIVPLKSMRTYSRVLIKTYSLLSN